MKYPEQRLNVLFVCMGNICRSPTAEGVFRKLLKDHDVEHLIGVDSAGTHAYHLGERPDQRACETARARGVEIRDLRARRVTAEDFERFDYILAMDEDNAANLRDLCPPNMTEKIKLFMDFAPEQQVRDVPDPYYGGQRGFERVFDLVTAAAQGLFAELNAHLSD
ncbi:low molecular weight protein-tyrosine-phosphatase [Chromatium okenii]|jgi:protein-tyrosine phosphatase|uniref:protein-tyrosine-phosphatase n=1 Tax=Chromatium okenii TaxID=61644 RepID=A0A2S7XRN0_9GAMM|nr:low molecular weight protein-tyrosine-phosphatase [Chromatium okenii]MBV5311351.1 low molecular weight phosphotyrosine protein phosphatase [Chromatium okenii]PQJ96365.1 phosphotyrosine protein phosphatase [Chromatium okenii]